VGARRLNGKEIVQNDIPIDAPRRLTLIQWLIVSLAAIGFAFDIYAILVAPLTVGPALRELGNITPGSERFLLWRSLLVYVPAIAGGVFGLLGGYLTDRLGRRRVLTGSILVYALSAFFSGYSTSPEMLLVLRCTTFIGVCVEFVAAVAWLAELFPNPHQRERVLGYTQAFSSVGGLLVAVVNDFILDYGKSFPAIGVPEFLTGVVGAISPEHQHEAWRYTLMSGVVPAIPLIFIRPFLPESPVWKQKKEAGTLQRPSIIRLFSSELRRITIVTTILFACCYGAAFGAIQHIPEIVKGLANTQQEAEGKPASEKARIEQKAGAEYSKVQEVGGLTGRFLLAFLAVRMISRRALLRTFLIPALIVLPLVFYFFLKMENREFFTLDLNGLRLGKLPVTVVSLGVFFAGLFTVAQFSFWGNYLPRVYPVYIRGTGESFAANIGGRAIGVAFWGVTNALVDQDFLAGSSPPEKFANAAALVGLFVFAVGFVVSFFLPEPKRESLPD
jgi:MFS family permease